VNVPSSVAEVEKQKEVMSQILAKTITEYYDDTNTTIGSCAFRYCKSLKKAEFTQKLTINTHSFSYCSGLTALILRNENVSDLIETNAFAKSPIETGTGYIYVPRNLVDAYKNGTNWSIFANQIRAIEDYPEITGGMTND
jgi:hypothetical protein